MALICGVYAEQCLNRVHLLDLAGELLRVERFCCATNPTSAIIVLLPAVNLHSSLPAFSHSLVALLQPCFCSLPACLKHSAQCLAATSSNSLRATRFMMSVCVHGGNLMPTDSTNSTFQCIRIKHYYQRIFELNALSQNGLSQNG